VSLSDWDNAADGWGAPLEGAARDLLGKAETVDDPDERSVLEDAKAWLRHTLRFGAVDGKLEWDRVDLENRLIYLEGRHTKAGKRRSVPLNRNAYDAVVTVKIAAGAPCPPRPLWGRARVGGNPS
jgi:hypothetical protein